MPLLLGTWCSHWPSWCFPWLPSWCNHFGIFFENFFWQAGQAKWLPSSWWPVSHFEISSYFSLCLVYTDECFLAYRINGLLGGITLFHFWNIGGITFKQYSLHDYLGFFPCLPKFKKLFHFLFQLPKWLLSLGLVYVITRKGLWMYDNSYAL